jgi:hypothetical protein
MEQYIRTFRDLCSGVKIADFSEDLRPEEYKSPPNPRL